jgi:AcrR family transcriptional regulator
MTAGLAWRSCRSPLAVSTRETQNKIIDAAIRLFNQSGTSSVSSTKIAVEAGISKGNLHYHYSTKGEIILAIWSRMELEISAWNEDELEPTIQHMARMVLRQYRQIWQYRFFYRELNLLLESDMEIKSRFEQLRVLRMEYVFRYFQAMAANGVIKEGLSELELRDLIRVSWIVSDFWLSFISVEDDKIDVSTMQEGYRLMLLLFKPLLTAQAVQEIPESFKVFSLEE